MLLLSAVLICLGFLALALSLDRHYRDVLGGKLSAGRRLALRSSGWLLLALGLVTCCLARGGQLGPVWFLGLAALAALVVLAVMSVVPSWRRSG